MKLFLGGGVKIGIGGNEVNLFPWKEIRRNKTEDKEAFENALNNPTSLFGKLFAPYCIIAFDNVGDSLIGGGGSAIFGYCYKDDIYGTQLMIKFGVSGFQVRNKKDSKWSGWKTVAAV